YHYPEPTALYTLSLHDALPISQAGSWPGAPPAAGDLACVLFTSGSSGTPKAIMLEHRNLIYLACNPTLVQLEPSDRFGQVSSLSDRKSTRLNSSHSQISYAVFC